ncbi:MAG: hypothetical protein ACTSVU_07995 [Promethearchaeota archaeon]
MSIQSIYEKMKENNLISGIILFDFITTISYLLNPFAILFQGDLDLLFGAIIGIIFAVKNQKSNYDPIAIGAIVGLLGSALAAISISILAILIPNSGNINNNFFGILQFELLFGVLIGVPLGLFVGLCRKLSKRNRNKLSKKKNISTENDDIFV